MNYLKVSNCIVDWLTNKLVESKLNGFVVGVSGGIDSAIVSKLCALTGKLTICVTLPIHQVDDQVVRADKHIKWLISKYTNVRKFSVDLTNTFDVLKIDLPTAAISDMSMVNTCARLRMTTLYAFAGAQGCLVAGTGNKIEDMGIGFFTKYGDGGVDISPIGDLLKSEVWEIGTYLGIDDDIVKAEPNDGLWSDGRSDEKQIGAKYKELEWAFRHCLANNIKSMDDLTSYISKNEDLLTSRDNIVLNIYMTRHLQNVHKMQMPPICYIQDSMR